MGRFQGAIWKIVSQGFQNRSYFLKYMVFKNRKLEFECVPCGWDTLYIKEYDNMFTDMYWYVFMRDLLNNLTQLSFLQARNEKIMKFKTPINEETNQSWGAQLKGQIIFL